MPSAHYATGRTIIARLEHGADLLEQLTGLAVRHGIEAGALQGVGALQRARLAWYDQAAHEYRELDFERPLEILSLLGNVSRRDGDVAVHAHVVVSGDDGAAFGGHVVAGCAIFACEAIVTELEGPPLARGHDSVTGLPLWETL